MRFIWISFLIIGYSSAILMYMNNRTDKILLSIDSMKYECIGTIANKVDSIPDSIFVDKYEDIDTTDYYMEGK